MISPQDVRTFKKQDSHILLRDVGTGKIGRVPLGVFPPPQRTLRRFRAGFQAQSHLGFDRHRVRYVVADRHSAMLFMTNAYTEISAFAVVVWYVYHDKHMLEFSALVRTIVKQATIYFIVIVAVQIYLQVFLSLGIVWSFARSQSFVTIG